MAMKTLDNLVVLITGAGGGFGQELARQLVAASSHVILADRRVDLLRGTIAMLARPHAGAPLTGRLLGYVEADLADPDGAERLYEQCLKITPHLDMLVNNAGMAVVGVISDVPQARWEQVMQVNLLAPMRLTTLFLPAMIARRSGHIVNISSVAGIVGSPHLSTYSAAKFGLRGFSEALAADVAPFGIDVTAVYPFFARTAILQAERFGLDSQPLPDRLLYDPAFVVAATIAGIRQRQLHVYPGAIPRVIDLLRRYAPWALPLLARAMY